jgi:hypothetical protein
LETIVRESNFAKRVRTIQGIKGGAAQDIPTLDGEAILQSAVACGFTPQGAQILKKVTLRGIPVKIHEDLCPKSLNGTIAQRFNPAGATNEYLSLPLEDKISGRLVGQAHLRTDDLNLRGDTTSPNPQLVLGDGLIKKLYADPLVLSPTPLGAINAGNVLAVIDSVEDRIPTEVTMLDVEILCSIATVRLYAKTYNANAANVGNKIVIDKSVSGERSISLPNEGTTLRGMREFTGNQVIAMPYNFVMLAADLEGDGDEFFLRQPKIGDALQYGVEWVTGNTYAFPQYFVTYKTV